METWTKECERILCSSVSQQGGFNAYLSALAPKDCGGQCTAIWPAGALAYRCRTCQLTPSSAVCVSCFKAGGHEDHDWIQYRSPSGGCCDCGDLSAWRIEGCCPAHQPNRRVVPLEQLLQPQPRMLLEAVLEAALAWLTECIGQCNGMRCSADKRRDFLALCSWLQCFASLAPVRRSMSGVLRRPLEHQPSPSLEETAAWQMQRRLEVLRETRNVVQQKLVWQQQDQRLQEFQGRIQGHLERQVQIQEEQRFERLGELQQALRTVVAGYPKTGVEAASDLSAMAAGVGAEAAAASGLAIAPASERASGNTITSVDVGAAPRQRASSAANPLDIAAAAKELAAAAALMEPSSVQRDTSALTSVSIEPLSEDPARALAANLYLMQAREVIARLPKSTPQARGTALGSHDGQDCLLRRWVHGLRWVHPEPLHHLTSLLLLLLYDMEFKYDTAVYLMECYAPMMSAIGSWSPSHQVPAVDGVGNSVWFGSTPSAGSGSGRHPLCGTLDRIVVQLFNSEEVTTRLVSERDVMGTHLSVLAYIMGIFVDELGKAAAPGAAAGSTTAPEDLEDANSALEQRMSAILDALRRLASDFGTLVHHASAARHLLCNLNLWREIFLGRFVRPLQAVLPHRRKLSGYVEERAAFRVPLACSAEYSVTACVCELITTVAGLRPAAAHNSGGGAAGNSRGGSGGGSDEEQIRRVELMSGAARQAFEACEEWCSERVQRSGASALAAPGAAAGGGGATFRRLSVAADLYDGLLSGELQASPHLPLHRTAAAFVQALLHLEQQGGPTGQLARSRIEQLLSLQASLDEGSAWMPVSRFLLLNQAFVSQVIARRWLWNGDDVSQVELFVLNGRELTELDVLMIQCWMAAEDPNVVLYDTLSAMGAKPLLVAAGVTAPGASATGDAPATASPTDLQDSASAAACSEALRWLVSLLRERTVAGLDPRDRLRSNMVQWLALRDLTYNQLHELLPQDLQQQPHMEEILAEVATYRAASLSQARHYSLKREAWELFCPAFIHYTPAMRSRAWEAAMAAARAPGGVRAGGRATGPAYQPHWQLRRPRHPLPASLEPMQRVLEANGLWRLVMWVLQTYLSGAPKLPEDTLLGTLNLLALQLQRLEDLLGRLSPPATCLGEGEGVVLTPPQLAGGKSESGGLQQISTPSQDKDQIRLRASILIGAQALTGGLRPAHARAHHLRHHHHHHHQDAQLHETQDHVNNFQPSGNHPQDVAKLSSVTGLVGLLSSLLQSQTPGLGPTVPPAAATSYSIPASVHLSSETVDCVKWLLGTARRLVQAADASDVHAASPRTEDSTAGMRASPLQDRDRGTSDTAIGTGTEGGAVTVTAEAAEGEATRRKELARQRQAAMMAKLRAQQEAFLRRAAGQGAGANDSCDNESADEDAAESDEKQDKRRESRQRLASAAGDSARQSFSGASGRLGGGEGSSIVDDDGSNNSSSSEDSRGVAAAEAGWTSSSPSDSGGDEGERGSDAVAHQEANSGNGGRHRRSRSRRGSPAAVAARMSSAAARQRLLFGHWLPVDIPEPECAVCREGTAGGRHGPLSFIAHTAVCFCTSAPLRPVRAWDEDPATQAAETVAPSFAAAGPAAVPTENLEDWAKLSDQQTAPNDPSKPRHGAVTRLGEAWLRVWRHQGPAVGEADLGGGLHVHCCGHMIHTLCFARFVVGQLGQYLAGRHFPGSHLIMPETTEFLCPVCRRLANGIVPAAPFQWRPPTAAVEVRTAATPRPLQSWVGPEPTAPDTVTGRVGCTREHAFENRGVSCTNDRSDDAIMIVEQDQPRGFGGRLLPDMGPAVEMSSAATTPSPLLPPLGHAAGLGALQGLMDSLRLCVESQEGSASERGPGPPRKQGAAARDGGLRRSPGSGNRGYPLELMYGAYADVLHLATHQMTCEGINQIEQLERALEARGRLMQLRSPPIAAATASPTSAAQAPATVSSPAVSAQQQGRLVQQELTSTEFSTSPHGGDTDSTAADTSRGAAAAEAAAVPTSASVNATRRSWPLRWQRAMPAPLRLPPPPEPKLACLSRRVTDLASVWKRIHSRTRLWSALAHNLAHFEAVRRPMALASGVLGSPAVAAADPAVARKQNTEEVGGAGGGSGAGGSVTGLPAVEAAHWRALVALAAMAMCGFSRPARVSSDAAVSAGPAPPSAASGAGLPVRATMDTAAATFVSPSELTQDQASAQYLQSPPQPYQQQPNPQLQPLLATFHTQLCWLLCELPTLGVTETPQRLPPPAVAPKTSIAEQQPLRSSPFPQPPIGGVILRTAPPEDFPAQPPPPATSLDWTSSILRPYLPEVIIPRLEATLIGGDTPGISSRSGSQVSTSAYLPVLAFRRLKTVNELTADPLLLTLELLSVGLSGLAGASLPAPELPLSVPGTGSAGTELAGWLPGSPPEFLRTVLRIVWPIQVLQGALWRTAGAAQDVEPAVAVGQPHRSAAASNPSRPEQAPPPPPPSEPDLPEEEQSYFLLVRLYFRALEELKCDQVPQPQGSACVDSDDACGPRLALGGLSAALLPFLVRAYALNCALSRQVPDPALMLAYSSLPLSQPRHHQPSNRRTDQRPSTGGTGSGQAAVPAVNEVLAADAATSPSRGLGTSSASANRMSADETAAMASHAVAATAGSVTAGTEAGPTEEEMRAATCTAALADHLIAALGLSDIPNALREPLLLSRRRAAEAVAAAAEAAHYTVEGPEAARSSSADSAGGSNMFVQSPLPPSGSPLSSYLEEALLVCILTRWCGPRAIALVGGTAAKRQGSPTGVGAAELVKDIAVPAAPPTSPKAGAAVTAALQQRLRLRWYRGLPPPPSLIPLPYLFQTLFLHFAETRCPDCGSNPQNPALCLLTGRFVCNLWRGCVDRNGTTGAFVGGLLHAREHCGGACLLLSLRSTRVVAVRGNRLAMCQSPYLDAHGDEDPDLRRGRPLYLDVESYRQLARLWGSAALEFDTQLLNSSRADMAGL